MPPVFAHGRLRLYLLKLLDEAPRHGYEIIRLLEERFQGLYAPSAGTVYPRLAKLAAEGLVTLTTEGGRKVYSITEAGRAELAGRSGELADLELEIRESVSALASDISEDVSGSARDLRREIREAARQARAGSGGRTGRNGEGAGEKTSGGEDAGRRPFPDASDHFDGAYGDKEAWRQAKEEFRRAKDEWKEQARRAKEESKRARQEAQRARKQARDAQVFAREEVQRVIKRVQEQTQDAMRSGDWPGMVREALSEVSREVGRFTGDWSDGARGAEREARSADQRSADQRNADQRSGGRTDDAGGTAPRVTVERIDLTKDGSQEGPTVEAPPAPAWAHEPTSGDPARDFDRLLDRFRDDLRDAARDHGVTADQLGESRRRLSTTAAHIGALLRHPEQYASSAGPDE
ncbi:putative PadR family transcriptional regulator [Streptomyces sp. NBRC 110611]|uniref:PadR family transcriptional regulator n=1 Tax=Streptomyces sp. NBRC 110611 TaxID=1621259 RepID=UPI0008322B53|nr:PadR family transcriptional regulator [Streptomyces sp. NBRC 110611]GAU65425.1 putative PadR family transcriptional regulator [Streptomyces sp. NBRC 110611]